MIGVSVVNYVNISDVYGEPDVSGETGQEAQAPILEVANEVFSEVELQSSNESDSSISKAVPLPNTNDKRFETLRKIVLIAGFALLACVPVVLAKTIYEQKQRIDALRAGFTQPSGPHKKELEMAKIYGDNILKLDSADPRPKLLYLLGDHDFNMALEVDGAVHLNDNPNFPTINMGVNRNLKHPNKHHDIRFKVISRPSQICEEIKEAAKVGSLKSVIINAHGEQNEIVLSKTNSLFTHFGYLNLDKNCFDGLDKDATIILMSCETGRSQTGIASAISQLSQREVWAPANKVASISTRFSSSVPPVPTFGDPSFLIGDYENLKGFESTCKFFPDGTSVCGTIKTSWIYQSLFGKT